MGFGDFVKKISNPVGLINDSLGIDLQDTWDSFTGKSQQESANAANISNAREAMAFSERMSSTAHVREVNDLKAAGINPMLSAKLGGASSPGGINATVAPVPSGTSKFVSTAMDWKRFADDRRTVNQNIMESQSRADMNSASAAAFLSQVDKDRGGLLGRTGGTAISNWIRKMFERGANSANKFSSEHKTYMNLKKKGRYKGPGSPERVFGGARDWLKNRFK